MRVSPFLSICFASILILSCDESNSPPPLPDPSPADAVNPVIILRRYSNGSEERVIIFLLDKAQYHDYWKKVRVTTPDTSFHDSVKHSSNGIENYAVFDFHRFAYPPD